MIGKLQKFREWRYITEIAENFRRCGGFSGERKLSGYVGV